MEQGSKRRPIVFISWAPFCSRSDGIAQRLGGKSFMVYAPFWGSHYATILWKYLVQALRTLWILIRERPGAILVMSPPVVACAPVWLYSLFARVNYAIDAHTAAFVDPRWTKVMFLHRFFSRSAATTIVTNSHLANVVERWKGSTTIVTDVPVYFAPPQQFRPKGNCNMTLVSTFTKDEPLETFFKAAAMVPEVQFYVTGGYQKADPRLLRLKPGNVELTGFLPDPQYVGLLRASDAILSLTTLDHTMQRGAYEAVYLGKPVITSNFKVLRESFALGTVHVDNDEVDVARGVRQMKDNLERYCEEVLRLRSEKLLQWERRSADLQTILYRRQ
jgi:glycosyltransferase involved in cell wall biosynthesis